MLFTLLFCFAKPAFLPLFMFYLISQFKIASFALVNDNVNLREQPGHRRQKD